MQPWQGEFRGRFERQWVESEALRDNPLGDPARRPLWVYLPPAYDAQPDRPFPAIYVLHGLTWHVDMWWNRAPFRPTTPENIDRLFSGDVPPAIVVLVDAWTSLGGSQFVNSPGTGHYLDYVCDDLVPFVDAAYRTVPAPESRGVSGHSSGGYGALVLAMLRPDVFGALASHSGDALFEACFLPDFRDVARALRDQYSGSFERFWQDFRSRPAFSRSSDHVLLNVYAMAACYSAEPDGSVTLPFEIETGKLRDEVWARWLENDPVRMVEAHAAALRGLRGIYLDAGIRDEAYLDLAATAISHELHRADIDHHFELHDAGHRSIEYRYPLGMAFLAEKLVS